MDLIRSTSSARRQRVDYLDPRWSDPRPTYGIMVYQEQ